MHGRRTCIQNSVMIMLFTVFLKTCAFYLVEMQKLTATEVLENAHYFTWVILIMERASVISFQYKKEQFIIAQ